MPVDKSDRRIREMFGEISGRYDFLNHFLSGGTDVYWRWRCVRAAPLTSELPILDICTGTGDLAIAFWRKARGRVRVIGADFTHEMLKLANRKVESLPAGAIEFVEADAQRLPFADDVFQTVSVAFGLRNISDTAQGLREMARVCAPGGRVVVLEFSLPTNRLIGGLYGWYFRNVLPRLGQLISRNRQAAYHYLPDSVSEFPSGKRLADMMNSCGLENATWQPLTFGLATVYVGTKPARKSVVPAVSAAETA